MHKSKTTFNTADLNMWHAKIQSELKGRNMDLLTWQVNPRIQMPPMLSADNHLSYPVQHPDRWSFAEKIDVYDAQLGNKKLLGALRQGIEAPYLILHKDVALDILFKSVRLDYVQVQIEYKSDGNRYNDINQHLVSVISRQPSPTSTWLITESRWENQYDVDIQLALLWSELTDLIDNTPEDNLEAVLQNLIIHIEVGNSFYLAIAKVNAVRILFDQWLRAINISNDLSPNVAVGVSTNDWTEDIHHNLINSATQCLSAVLGGANQIFIPASDSSHDQQSQRYRRMARNIHQLLALESKLHQWDDPIKGSYYLETLSYKIAQSAWHILQKKVADNG